MLLTTTGGVIQNMHDPQAFYRVRINDDRNAGFIAALSLSNAPAQALAIARQFLEELLLEDAQSELLIRRAAGAERFIGAGW